MCDWADLAFVCGFQSHEYVFLRLLAWGSFTPSLTAPRHSPGSVGLCVSLCLKLHSITCWAFALRKEMSHVSVVGSFVFPAAK